MIVKESIHFERTGNPLKDMGVGLSSPRTFKNIEDFVDYIIKALPLIFDGEIPDDILSRHEEGALPETYYGTIAEFLEDHDMKMPDGNKDWEGSNDNFPKEFRQWPQNIQKRLEKILGEKRWSSYDADDED